MSDSWRYFLLLLLIALVVQGFYSMLEMACVSFNRVRLQYYVSQDKIRAKWVDRLLKSPSHLFATTLIGANAAMQFGSECARRLYASLGLNPDWSALSQVFIVLIFAELSPMFAARRFAERISMLGIPLLYLTALILRPITAILEALCYVVNRLFGVKSSPSHFLSRDELRCAIEKRDDNPGQMQTGDLDPVLSNLFSLRSKTAKDLMESLDKSKLIPSDATVEDLRSLLGLEALPFIPLYHKVRTNIVAIAFPRDLIRYPNKSELRAHSRPPWFVSEKRSLFEIIKEFRRNNQSLAVVLNGAGAAVGILKLDAVVDEIFGHRYDWILASGSKREKHQVCIDRSFPGETKVSDINAWFKLSLPDQGDESVEELMTRLLNRRPEKGEPLKLGDIELMVEESSLISGKTISIRSL